MVFKIFFAPNSLIFQKSCGEEKYDEEEQKICDNIGVCI